MVIEDDPKLHRHWGKVAAGQYTRALDADATVGRLHHHMAILQRPHYMRQFFSYTKSLTVRMPFFAAQDSIFTVLGDFVASEERKTTTLAEVLSVDEDSLFTAVTRLVLASHEPALLRQHGYDQCKDTHLHAFERVLGQVAGFPRSPASSSMALEGKPRILPSSEGTVAILRPTMRDEAREITDVDQFLVLVGPASHYVKGTRYISGKTTAWAASNEADQPRPIAETLFAQSPDPVAQDYTVHPRFVLPSPPPLWLLRCPS